jgi:hypothetical protein
MADRGGRGRGRGRGAAGGGQPRRGGRGGGAAPRAAPAPVARVVVASPAPAPAPAPVAPVAAVGPKFDATWVVQACGSEEMALALIQILHRYAKADDIHLQDSLFSLLGETKMDVLPLIFENFDRIKANTSELRDIHPAALQQVAAQPKAPSFAVGLPSNVPSVSTGVTVTSEAQKKYLKEQRKAAKKAKKTGQIDDFALDGDDNEFKVKGVPEETTTTMVEQKLDNFNPFAGTEYETTFGTYGGERKSVLPPGAVRSRFQKSQVRCESVFVPAPKKYEAKEELSSVEEAFDDYGKVVFRGMPTLNALQTKCYLPAYHSNENILVCAPTGSGKCFYIVFNSDLYFLTRKNECCVDDNPSRAEEQHRAWNDSEREVQDHLRCSNESSCSRNCRKVFRKVTTAEYCCERIDRRYAIDQEGDRRDANHCHYSREMGCDH